MTAAEPEYGRLDRILAAQAASPEAIPPEAERGCYMGDGCLGQHTMVMHVYLEDAVSANLDAKHVETVLSIFASDAGRLRARVAALEAECAALTDALAALTHAYEETSPPGIDPFCAYCLF